MLKEVEDKDQESQFETGEFLLDELITTKYQQKSKGKAALEKQWDELSSQRKKELLKNQLVKKGKMNQPDQIQSYDLLKRIQQLCSQCQSEDVDELSDMIFQCLRNMRTWHKGYERVVKQSLTKVMAINKAVVNKKLGVKMKEQGFMNKLLRVLGDNLDMRKVLRGVVEKNLKEQVLVASRDSKAQFHREYILVVDQQMIDETVMPAMMKLLRRSEANVNLLLEYLESHDSYHKEGPRLGWFNQSAQEVVCNIFGYSNESTRNQQLKSAQLLLKHTTTEIIPSIQQKIIQQNQESKKLNFLQSLGSLVRDEKSGKEVMQVVMQSVSWMSLDDNIGLVAQIIENVKRVCDQSCLGEQLSWDSLLKAGNKVQGQISCMLATCCLEMNVNSVKTDVVQSLVSSHVDNQLKNINKLVTNYPLLLAGLSVQLASPQLDNQKLFWLRQQLAQTSVFLNQKRFYEQVTPLESSVWLQSLMKLVRSCSSEETGIAVLGHSFVQCVLCPGLSYKQLCSELALQKEWTIKERQVFLKLIVTGLFMMQYYETASDLVNEPQGEQKVRELLKCINSQKEMTDCSNEFMWMYLKVNKSFLKKETLSEEQLSFVYSYLLSHIDDGCQNQFFQALVHLDLFQPIFDYAFIFAQKQIDNPDVINQAFYKPQMVQQQNLYKSLLNSQTTQIKAMGFPFRTITVGDHQQIYADIKEEAERGQEIVDFYDEHQLKQHQKQEFKKKLSYFQEVIGKYMTQSLGKEKAQRLFFEQVLDNLMDLVKDDTIFERGTQQLLVALFSQQKDCARFKYTLSDYVLGMKDTQQQMNFEQNQEVNLFLRNMNKQVNMYSCPQWLSFLYRLSEYVIRCDDSEINSKQQSISIMNQIIKKTPELSGQSVDIVLQQANSLSVFSETFVLLEQALQQMESSQQHKYIKFLLNQLLQISDSAQLLFFKVALMFKGFEDDLDIELKMRVCQQADFSSQVQEVAGQAISNISSDNFTLSNIQTLQIDQLQDNNREHLQSWLNILLSKIGQKPVLIKALFKQSFNQVSFKDENLYYYIDLINIFLTHMPNDFLLSSLRVLIGECCKYEVQMQQEAVDCGIAFIQEYIRKADLTSPLLEVLDGYLADKQVHQQVQTSAMVLLGSCGNFLKSNYETKMRELSEKVVDILIESSDRNTQLSMAKCLPNMIIFFSDPCQQINQSLAKLHNDSALKANKLRGLGYMVASFIKGTGVRQIEKVDLLNKIADLKLEPKLYLINCLQEILQKLLEPYVENLLIHIIQGFGDQDNQIRQLSVECAKNSMNNLSAYGVKRVLPVLLKELDDGSGWRSKVAKIWALGNMAFCSPKQLSKCLPIIVPKLSEQLTDTHPQIRQGANEALKVIGSTIKNPEISEIIEILIKSLSDPFYENQKGLNVLLKTTFVHYIDIPALSLVVPIIEYALKSRDSEQKQDGARLIGTISTLIKDSQDLMPYLDCLLNGLLIALNDPISEIRSMAAKATGVLAKKLEMINVKPLLDRLYGVLDNQESTSVERAGAAQGLAETYGQLGQQYFNYILPELIEKQQNPSPRIKEGYLGIFMYLHLVMEDGVEYYLQDILDTVVAAISDTDDQVRGLGQRVLRAFIRTYGSRQSEVLLMRVNEGLFAPEQNKRLACCSLLGELIPILRKQASDRSYYTSLVNIYILRGDPHTKVVTEATNVWKAEVSNTPKTLKRELTCLLVKLGELLMKQDETKQCANQCLYEFSGKYGEAWIDEIGIILVNQVNTNVTALSKNPVGEHTQLLRGIFEVMAVFYEKCQRDSVFKSCEQFVSIVHLFQKEVICNSGINPTELSQMVLAMVRCSNVVLERMGNEEVVERVLSPFLKDLEEKGEQTIIGTFLQESGRRVRKHIIPFIFASPLSLTRIETITNNAQELAKDLYSTAHQTTQVVNDLYSQLGDPALQNEIMYCLQLLSVHLENNHANTFLEDTLDNLRSHSHDINRVQNLLEILSFFFNKGDFQIQDQANEVMELLIPILLECDVLPTVQLLQSTMKALLTVRSRQECFDLIHSLVSNFQVVLYKANEEESEEEDSEDEEENDKKVILGLNSKDCLEPYIDILVSSMAYGSFETLEFTIEFYQILSKNTTPEFLNPFLFRLMGPLVRAMNYKAETYLKIKLLKLLQRLYKLKLDFTQFNVPLEYSLMKGLNEAQDPQLIKLYIQILISLIQTYSRPQAIYNRALRDFVQTKNQNFIQFIYNLLKKGGNFKFTKSMKNRLIEFLLDDDNSKLLYKNAKITREKGKILGLLANNSNSQEQVDNFFLKQLQNFNKTKSSQDKLEEILHHQYLYITEIIAFIYLTEDVQIKEEKTLVQMIQETILQLNNNELIDVITQSVLRALANNEDGCKLYFDYDFIDELSQKWTEEELIQDSLNKIKIILED